MSISAAAPTYAQQAADLPPLLVEGATVEKPKSPARNGGQSANPKPAPTAAGEQGAQTAPVEQTTSNGEQVEGVPVNKLGSSITVVTGEQLRQQQIRQAADALRSLPGVAVSQTSSGGGLTQVRIRGAEGNHTLVMIDGIDASDGANNEFDFSNLMAEDIERIELIRGAQSGIYGSKAIGGVINIITKGGKGPIRLAARTEYGGFDTRDVSARVSGGTDRAWVSLSAQHREQNNFNVSEFGGEDDPWSNSAINFKAGLTLFEGVVADVVVRNTKKSADLDFEGFIPATGLNGAVDAFPSYTDANVLLAGANVRWDMLNGALTHIVKANHNGTESESLGEFGPSSYEGTADTYSYLGTYRFATPSLLSRHSVSGLVEKKDERFTPSSDFVTRDRSHVATVGEYRGEFLDRLFVNGTVRHDDNENFADFTTWRAGLSIDLQEIGVRPHASTGTGVALPSMFEQFGFFSGSFIGNPNLKPEESFSWDVGLEFTFFKKLAVLDVTYFHADLTNKIAGVFFPDFTSSLVNLAGESERQGVEVSGRVQLPGNLSIGAAYTYLDATDPNGLREIRRPPHAGRADINYSFLQGRGNFNLAAVYNGEMNDNNFTFPVTRVLLDEYWLITAAASYKLNPSVEIYGRVENLLNEHYQEVSGYNTADIAAYAGVRISLEDPNTASWAR